MAEELQYSTKRKYEDPTTTPTTTTRRQTGFSAPISSISPQDSNPNSYNNVPPPVDDITLAKQKAQEIAARLFNTASNAEAKRPRVENGDDSNDYLKNAQAIPSLPIPYGFQGSTGGGYQSSGGGGGYQSGGYQSGSSKKIDIPNERVGVIIGKSGETIKYLQTQSGAKIQVTRDMDADPNSRNRAVELMGTSEQISHAERLIKDVLAEAESGSTGMAPKRFVPTPGAEQFSMKVPSNKVGLIIGKGGETIKNMQARSGARIQLIPLHPPPGDTSTERTVYIDGTQQQIEVAKQLVNEVISENRLRNPSMGGGYSQQSYRPPTQNWGQPPAVQQPGYGYMQPGAYQGAPPQYNMPQPPYTGYPPQSASTGWDQTAAPPSQQTTPGTGYDYYNQAPAQQPAAGGSTTPTADSTGGYNYSQPPVSTYNQPQAPYGGSTYPQQPPAQQGYTQDGYGGYPPAPQGGYGQQQATVQPGYDQSQGYNSAPSYGASATPAQDGTYGSQGAGTQVVPPVQPPIANQQGYGGQQPTTPTNYPTQGSQPGYPPQTGYGTQVSAQPGSAPPTQASYGQPPVQNPPPNQGMYGHAQPASSQGGYAQPAPVQPAYAHSQSTPTHTAPATSESGHHRPPATGLAPAAPQAGYVQQPYGVPTTAPPAYGAQQQAYGGDSYAAGYSKPPVYSGESTVGNNAHGTYDAAPGSQPNQQSGVAKTSPPS